MKYVLTFASCLGFALITVSSYERSWVQLGVGCILFFGSIAIEATRKETK